MKGHDAVRQPDENKRTRIANAPLHGHEIDVRRQAVPLFCLLTMACYNRTMTKLLDQALEAARSLSPDAQDDIARVVLRLAGTDDEASPVALAPEERAAVAASKAAAGRGEFATDEQVRAVWAKHGL